MHARERREMGLSREQYKNVLSWNYNEKRKAVSKPTGVKPDRIFPVREIER